MTTKIEFGVQTLFDIVEALLGVVSRNSHYLNASDNLIVQECLSRIKTMQSLFSRRY